MQRYRWERFETVVEAVCKNDDCERVVEKVLGTIAIIDGRDGTQYAITDDVQKAERIVACLNYGEQIAKTV